MENSPKKQTGKDLLEFAQLIMKANSRLRDQFVSLSRISELAETINNYFYWGDKTKALNVKNDYDELMRRVQELGQYIEDYVDVKTGQLLYRKKKSKRPTKNNKATGRSRKVQKHTKRKTKKR